VEDNIQSTQNFPFKQFELMSNQYSDGNLFDNLHLIDDDEYNHDNFSDEDKSVAIHSNEDNLLNYDLLDGLYEAESSFLDDYDENQDEHENIVDNNEIDEKT